jgi:hypothetical protein
MKGARTNVARKRQGSTSVFICVYLRLNNETDKKTDFLKKPVFFSGTGQNRTAVQNGY